MLEFMVLHAMMYTVHVPAIWHVWIQAVGNRGFAPDHLLP